MLSYGLLYMDMLMLVKQQRLTSALYKLKQQPRRPAMSDGW